MADAELSYKAFRAVEVISLFLSLRTSTAFLSTALETGLLIKCIRNK
jgi:hypothetical protein